MTLSQFFQHFDLLADQPDAVAKMRELVLQLAIRGQIVEQIAAEQKDGAWQKFLKSVDGKDGGDELPPFDIPKDWRWTRLVDDGSEYRQSQLRTFQEVRRQVKQLKFATWTDVAAACCEIVRKRRNFKSDPTGSVIAHELASHLKENNMSTEPQPEIYLRDVSGTHSVQLYFRHQIYKCQSNFYNSARRNIYFAPYFTRQMADKISADNLVPVGEGISFVSRVKKVVVVSKNDVLAFLKAEKHPSPKEAAELVRRNHRGREVLVMTLGVPRLMFVSPVTKAKLAKIIPFGQGAMGSRSCTFDDLLAASQ